MLCYVLLYCVMLYYIIHMMSYYIFIIFGYVIVYLTITQRTGAGYDLLDSIQISSVCTLK